MTAAKTNRYSKNRNGAQLSKFLSNAALIGDYTNGPSTVTEVYIAIGLKTIKPPDATVYRLQYLNLISTGGLTY